MKKGRFITFEGGEGAGKTTQIKMLSEYLEKKEIDFICTREPGGIDIAEQIREVILDKKNTKMDKKTEALLYAASRRQHMAERVIPAIEAGTLVICDRFIDSSLVYQGFARGVGAEEVMAINEFAIEGYMPNTTIYLDIDVEEGLARIERDSKREVNRLDLEAKEFHEKIRQGYKELAKQFPERIVTIDANRSTEEVFKDIVAIIENE